MKKSKHLQEGMGPFELIEEAIHLLRLAPAGVLFSYYAGSLPFILGLLYFWSDMSRSAFAEDHLAVGAFGLTILFLWMKTWQAVFAQHLLARLCREPAPRWTFRRVARAAGTQAILQPSGLFLLPVALAVLVPFGWTYAFYQNVTALAADEGNDVKATFKKAWQQARTWPMQNHYVLFVFKAFGFFVLVNVVTAILGVPFLLNTLLGVETIFSQSGLAALNTTFFAVVVAVTYLCLDPILKSLYVLRCFYGESLQSGRDLKAELRNFHRESRLAAVLIVSLSLFGGLAPGAAAAENPSTPQLETRNPKPVTPQPSVTPPALDRSIDDVISQREYAWRMPREKRPETLKEKGAVLQFLEGIARWLGNALKALGRWAKDAVEWLFKLRQPPSTPGSSSANWQSTMQGVLLFLIAVLVAILGVLLFRMWQRRRRGPVEAFAAAALPTTPDLTDEGVGADQLPEDGWLKLARELLERGEARLALRAFYLASLAHLAQRHLITIAKFKSNRDYERELGRRSHALPEVMELFTQNVSTFDRVWYGLHEVNQDLLNRFAQNVERIKAHG